MLPSFWPVTGHTCCAATSELKSSSDIAPADAALLLPPAPVAYLVASADGCLEDVAAVRRADHQPRARLTVVQHLVDLLRGDAQQLQSLAGGCAKLRGLISLVDEQLLRSAIELGAINLGKRFTFRH